MTREAAIVATVTAGGLVAIQAPVNARLGDQVGKFGTGFEIAHLHNEAF